MGRKRISPETVEWALLAVMVAVGLALSILQYLWTGNISRAEGESLRAALNGRVQRLGAAFDRDITASIAALLPESSELDEKGFDAGHNERYQQWQKLGPRPMFARIGVVVPRNRELELWEWRATGMVPMALPAEWGHLREQFRLRAFGDGPAPRTDAGSLLVEAPVFGEDGEREWVVLELDSTYLRNVWLPELAATYLEPGVGYEVKSTAGVVASSGQVSGEGDARVKLFPMAGIGRGGRGGRRGGGLGRRNEEGGRWTLKVAYQGGSVATVIREARIKNLAVAFGLNGMLVLAGLVLLRYTRRSRRLADQQLAFVAGVSHELRTPLTVIRGAGHNLLAGLVNDREQIEKYARAIVQHSGQLSEMIEQLLAFESARKGTRSGKKEPVWLHEVITEGLDAAESELESSGCEVELKIAADLPPVVGDRLGLRRVFQNLAANVARYASAGKWIGIEAEGTDGFIEVRVQDRGPGIPAAELDRIFEAFYRGENARVDHVRGTGLGLSLVKSIVEEAGGTVAAHNRPDGGLEVAIRLPAAREGEYDEFSNSAG